MAWTTITMPQRDTMAFMDRLGALQLAISATGDKTSYVIYDGSDTATGISTLYCSPEAEALFRAELSRFERGTAEALPPKGQYGVFIELHWPR